MKTKRINKNQSRPNKVLFKKNNMKKFIPVIKKGNFNNCPSNTCFHFALCTGRAEENDGDLWIYHDGCRI